MKFKIQREYWPFSRTLKKVVLIWVDQDLCATGTLVGESIRFKRVITMARRIREEIRAGHK